ncbi:MAG TPA: acyltransferase [Xanthobacteraceae bacterium]|jgi:acetyltransferase-like isoleucine patch superfamily enzyme
MNFFKRLLGAGFSKIQGYSMERYDAVRTEQRARVARIDATTNVDGSATFLNSRGNPDDIKVGPNSAVLGEFVTFPPGGRIVIGEHCFVGKGARIWSAASIIVGNYVLIAHDVNIHDHISHSLSWSERRQEIDKRLPHMSFCDHRFEIQESPMVIEDDVWIGFGASIIGGVHIGRGAVIGAHSVVTKDVPAFSLVVGNPMRVVRQIPGEMIEEQDVK